jgi:hypothetical protein
MAPTALSASVEATASDCVSFYKSHLESDYLLPLFEKAKYFTLDAPHGTQVTIINLALADSGSKLDKLVQSYFLHVQNIYRERLKKFMSDTSEVIADRAHIDQQLEKRSILVLDTPAASTADAVEFNGGLRVTMARNADEKLPFQYELPEYKRHDQKGISVELGRLTALTSLSAKITVNLIKIAVQVTLQNLNVSDFYVHTSKAHARLYKLMGFVPTDIDIKDDLNYVLRFTREDAIAWLAQN